MPSTDCHLGHVWRWSHEEILLLINLWMSDDSNKKFDGTSRDSLMYADLVDALKARGFVKSTQQVRLKMRNLKREYEVALAKRCINGEKTKLTFRYFNELDKYLRSGKPTVSSPTVIYMDQTLAGKKRNSSSEESIDVNALMEVANPDEDTERQALETPANYELVSSEPTVTSSDEENIEGNSQGPATKKSKDRVNNSDHTLYAAKESNKELTADDMSLLKVRKTSQESQKARLDKIEDVLSRVLNHTMERFMKFEQRIEEKNREETNSFRNEILALEHKKLEESVSQTLQNDRLIVLMESLLSKSQSVM